MQEIEKDIQNKTKIASPQELEVDCRKLYNFDEIIDRKNTDSVKVERCKALFGTENVLPLWVADMDFRTPDFILDAIKKRLEHPILGYTVQPKNFFPLIQNWIQEHHNWEVKREWIGFLRGIVPGLSFAVQSLTDVGDEVIVQPPVYYPFFNVIKHNNRTVVHNQLIKENNIYRFDYDDFEKKITPSTKLFILCNPHNPGGRVWTFDELKKIAVICERHQITVVSDEIHADMVLPGNTAHTPFATVSDWAKENTVTFMAPSKVFNMPGVISSSYIIPNETLRNKFAAHLEVSEMNTGNIFSYAATVACYEKGEDWRVQMLEYVQGNVNYIVEFLKTNIPQIVPMIPEASFLVWLDCTGLGMETDELHKFFSLEAGLGLNKGSVFGPGGEYHLRMNVACSREILKKAMQQLYTAVNNKR